MGQIINIADIHKRRKVRSTSVAPEGSDETKKYLNILSAILTSGNEEISKWVKTAIDEVHRAYIEAEKRKQERGTREFREKIREILRNTESYEKEIRELDEQIINKISKRWGTPLTESTLKQIKCNKNGKQRYLDQHRQSLTQYTEDEIREAIEKEVEDKAREKEEQALKSREDDARNFNRKSIMGWITRYEKEIKRCKTKLEGGINTHGKYRGQPLSEDDIKGLNGNISYKEEKIREAWETLKLKDKMGLK